MNTADFDPSDEPLLVDARRQPVRLLIGLAAGLVITLLAGIVFWPAAPFAVFILGALGLVTRPTTAFGVGLIAAGCGIVAFLIAMAVAFLIL